MQRWEKILLIVAIPFLTLCVVVSIGGLVCGTSASAAPTTAHVEGDGTLTIKGGIDDKLVVAVRKALGEGTQPIQRISIDSFGGVERSMDELARILFPLHVETEIPEGAICESACIGLLTKASGPVVVKPTAILMFHSAAWRFGLAEHGFCGSLNRVLVATSRPSRDMLPWARQLSDKLPVVFALCGRNPLDTDKGMMLTGAEFNGLQQGTVSPEQLLNRCPEWSKRRDLTHQ